MGAGSIKNGVQQVITPRSGRNWCDVVNTQPMPKQVKRYALALGTCSADGSNYRPYDTPIVREVFGVEPRDIFQN